jgi:hypothetical protein
MLLNTASHSRFADLISLFSLTNWLRNITLSLGAALCTLPCLVEAVQIGGILSTSKLGEPLRVEVAITTAANEQIDDSCVSLVAPDTQTDDASNYLRDTKLSVQNIGGQQRILLNARKPFNHVFGKFKLQVKCRDQGSIAKTFTILPDLADSVPLPEQVASVIEPAVAPQVKVEPAPAKQVPQADAAIEAPVIAQPAIAKSPTHHSAPAKSARPEVSQPRVALRTRANNLGGFQLKISGEPLDASRIGKISPEERTFLLGSQKLLDSDDQMASILSLQNQVKQLQEDIGDMRAKLAQLGAPAHVNAINEATANATAETNHTTVEAASSPIVASTSVAVAASQPVTVQKTTAAQKSDWRAWAWLLGLLGLAVIGLVLGLRRYARSKLVIEPLQIFPNIVQIHPAPTDAPLPSNQPASPGETTVKIKAMAQAVVAAKASSPQDTQSATPAKSPVVSNASSEVDAVIEEAQLYAAFNHPQRAVKILLELLVDNPKKSEAWLLLLAILASLKSIHEFENNARAFLRYNPQDTESWITIQILGRTLSPASPLYRDNSPALSPGTVLGERHLIGDVLIDLEMISPESLHHCLAHFDAKKHGRLGAFLVTEKIITHQQLTQALVHQHALNQGAPYIPPVDLEFEAPERAWRG